MPCLVGSLGIRRAANNRRRFSCGSAVNSTSSQKNVSGNESCRQSLKNGFPHIHMGTGACAGAIDREFNPIRTVSISSFNLTASIKTRPFFLKKMKSKKKGRKQIHLCPCGVDFKEYPHDDRVCAPHLWQRLQKMRDLLITQGEWAQFWANRGAINADQPILCDRIPLRKGQAVTTAFPVPTNSYGWREPRCVKCGHSAPSYYDRLPPLWMYFDTFTVVICEECVYKAKPNISFCPITMQEGWSSCIRPMARLVSLILLRNGVPLYLRVMIRRILFRVPGHCLHPPKRINDCYDVK